MDASIRDKIYACWLGKSIGGTLGTPVEGCKDFMSLTFYPDLGSGGALPNDDLDLQLLNLHALEQHGLLTDAEAIAAEWLEHVRFPWDEYGYSLTAMRKGLRPPYSGFFDNPFTDCMGSPIRSEIWAVAALGDPVLAAYFAWQDAVVDHAGGEGVYGEMFYAAIETLAVFGGRPCSLIEQALSCIPPQSRVSLAVADTLKWFREGVGYPEIRSRILSAHGSPNFTDAPQNIAFSLVGLLYGADFEDGMLKTVNLGYDTDCTVATLGSLYGLLYGSAFIPEKWSAPIGERIVVSPAVTGLDAPADIRELTDRSVRLAESFAALDRSHLRIVPEEAVDAERQTFVFPSGDPRRNLLVTLRCEEGISLAPGEVKPVRFTFRNNSPGRMELCLSTRGIDGLQLSPPSPSHLRLEPGDLAEVSLDVSASDGLPPVSHPSLMISRLHNGCPWNGYELPFTLLRTGRWLLNGVTHNLPGTLVAFKEAADNGLYVAETAFTLPETRTVKVMAASVSPISAEVDGQLLINDPDREDPMPAYHRCPPRQCHTCELGAGRHTLRVTLRENERLPDFRFALLAPAEVEEPGNHFAYIDAVVG